MTAIKITTEHKTILDFSDGKVSRNHITNKVRCADFLEFTHNDKYDMRTYLSYDIKIGIYTVYVDLLHTASCAKKLKDYGTFCVRIFEGGKEVNLKRDVRFRTQSWAKDSNKFKMRIPHLVEAIMFCNRLNHLKAFL
jgi:hypothetical protein